MNKPRIVFFGSKNSKFSDELFFALTRENCQIVAVVHTPEGRLDSTSGKINDTGYAEAAGKLGIPEFAPDDPNTPEFAQSLRSLGCDAFILAGYAVLVKEELMALPKTNIAINFHASLLPAYKGKHPVFWAVRNGETKSGITAHHLNQGLDEGNIAFQEEVDIDPDDSASDVYDKVIEKGRLIMHDLIEAIREDNVPAIPQKGEGSYYSSVKEEDYILDFSYPADRNKWAVKATPGKCYINTKQGKIYAYEAQTRETADEYEDGTIISMDKDGIAVYSGGAAVCFRRLSMGGELVRAETLVSSLGYNLFDRL